MKRKLGLALAVLAGMTSTAAANARDADVARIDRILANTPLARHGRDFVRSGHRWHINPYFIVAISGAESSFGKARCGFNSFGINSCKGYNFNSDKEAIEADTKLANSYQIDSVWVFAGKYICGRAGSSCGNSWASVVSGFLYAWKAPTTVRAR